jgi:hypothetical protein
MARTSFAFYATSAFFSCRPASSLENLTACPQILTTLSAAIHKGALLVKRTAADSGSSRSPSLTACLQILTTLPTAIHKGALLVKRRMASMAADCGRLS